MRRLQGHALERARKNKSTGGREKGTFYTNEGIPFSGYRTNNDEVKQCYNWTLYCSTDGKPVTSMLEYTASRFAPLQLGSSKLSFLTGLNIQISVGCLRRHRGVQVLQVVACFQTGPSYVNPS